MSIMLEITDEIEDSFIAWLIISYGISVNEFRKLYY